MSYFRKPIIVVIDSYFPVDANQNELIFAKPNGKELWVLILEKAWAKLALGAYKNCENLVNNNLLKFKKKFSTKIIIKSYSWNPFLKLLAF